MSVALPGPRDAARCDGTGYGEGATASRRSGSRQSWLAGGAVAVFAGLAAAFGWVLERQEGHLIQIERRALAEAEADLVRLRVEQERLRARLPGADERRQLEEEAAALAKLRAEVEAAQKRMWPGGRP